MSKIKFIVKLPDVQKEYVYKKTKNITEEDLVSSAVEYIESEHPGYCNAYKSLTEEDTWRVFGDRITARDISEVSGASYHVVRLWVHELKEAKKDNIESRDISILFENFMDPDFQERIKEGRKPYKTRKPVLEGQEALIEKYILKDGLSVVSTAKALGVAANTLRSYLVVNMAEVEEARRRK